MEDLVGRVDQPWVAAGVDGDGDASAGDGGPAGAVPVVDAVAAGYRVSADNPH